MLTKVKDRMTYANVTASLALFVALGGSSYAALSLPRDSVGANQIRAGAVRSSEIHNGSVTTLDISKQAKAALRGATGPQGPAGSSGAPAARFFAAMTAAGALVRGNAASGGRSGSPGTYVVGFASSARACVATATLGSTDGSVVAPGRITISDSNGQVAVQTYDASGAPADSPFQLIVAC